MRMTPLPKPDVILTHESDLDGLLAGCLLQRLAKRLFGTETPLEAYHYNFWKQRELRERSAWVADFTFEPRLDREDWVIIDHHVTEAAPKKCRLIHDVNLSAASLCYGLCKEHGIQSPELDRLVHLNNVADLFLELDPDFEIAGDYANLVKSYQFWNLHALMGGQIERMLNHPLLEVMEVKRRVENPLGFEWSRGNVKEISPTVGFVDTVVGNNNLVVHQLLEQHATKYPVLVTLFRRVNSVFASFRSRNGEVLPKSVRNITDGIEYLRQTLNIKKETHQSRLNSLESLFAVIEAEQK
jgi:hypothetical protein